MSNRRTRWIAAIAPALIIGAIACATEQSGPAIKTENFDRDPGWEAYNNHIEPKVVKAVRQGFGYSATNFAGKEKGEIGGVLWRSSTRAFYAEKIPSQTLNEKLEASGTFALLASDGSSGAFFGWFKADEGELGRRNSLGFRLAGQGSGARLTLQLVTADNQACGTKITPWVVDKSKPRGEGRKFRPTSIKNDGTRYTWNLTYDPNANSGDGQMQFVVRSNSAHPDDFEGKTFTVNLPKGYRQRNTRFDRFGLKNGEKPGNPLTIYFDDVTHDGRSSDFSQDPKWEESGNQAAFAQSQDGGTHDFGFIAKSNFAGGTVGEIGGTMWRCGSYAYYADRLGPVCLDDRLEASGKIVLSIGLPDSGMYFGWFNSREKEDSPVQAGEFLGIKIGGPTRVGHYFTPAYATTQTKKHERGDREHPPNISVERKQGPLLVPQKVFQWKLIYDPAANDGNGAIEATLGDESVTLPLKDGDKERNATFDRFGLFTTHIGGSYLKVYLDNVSYTARRESPQGK